MSVDERTQLPAEPFTLGQFIAALIEALGSEHPAALLRMRQVVGNRRARIVLDEEAVDIYFGADGLIHQPATKEAQVDGEGATDNATVLALLDGYLEVTDAIFNGQLRVTGKAEEIARMLTAIEILLDASPRTPVLQALAAKFRSERRERRSLSMPVVPRRDWYPFISATAEYDLLARFDLLPDVSTEEDQHKA